MKHDYIEAGAFFVFPVVVKASRNLINPINESEHTDSPIAIINNGMNYGHFN